MGSVGRSRFVASDNSPILNFGSRTGRILHGDYARRQVQAFVGRRRLE